MKSCFWVFNKFDVNLQKFIWKQFSIKYYVKQHEKKFFCHRFRTILNSFSVQWFKWIWWNDFFCNTLSTLEIICRKEMQLFIVLLETNQFCHWGARIQIFYWYMRIEVKYWVYFLSWIFHSSTFYHGQTMSLVDLALKK